MVLYSDDSGLTTDGSQFWTQNTAGVPDQSETGDGFGSALAVGDVFYLAIGVPGEDVEDVSDAGAVNVIYLAKVASGDVRLDCTGRNAHCDLLHQNVAGIPDAVEPADHFGAALVAAPLPFQSSSLSYDLAIGVRTRT